MQSVTGNETDRVAWLSTVARQSLLSLAGGFWAARGTTTWLAIVSATQLVLAHASSRLDTALLLSTSTNLANLRSDPLNVLVTSACIVASTRDYLEFLIECVFLLAPLENRLGTLRWLVGLVVGHVGATLIVAIALSTSLLETSTRPARVIDVGVSYGVTCLAVVLAYELDGWKRLAVAALVLAVVSSGLATQGGFNDWGHFAAAALGLAIGPVLVIWRSKRLTTV